MMQEYLLALDIGGTKTAMGLYDTAFRLCHRAQYATDTARAPEQFISLIRQQANNFIRDTVVEPAYVRAGGVVFAGHVNHHTGVIESSANIRTLRGVGLRDRLSRALGMPVALDNDANGATLAEYRLGAGQGHGHMIYVTVSTGIGGGVILDGRLLRGHYGMAGEMGHMKVMTDGGYPCNCGKSGCVESYASGPNIARYVRDALAAGQKSCLAGMEGITAKETAQAAKQGDELALRAFERAGAALGYMLANVYELINMECVVYGGSVCKAEEVLIGPMRRVFYENAPNIKNCPVQLRAAQFKDDACLLGAALLAQEII